MKTKVNYMWYNQTVEYYRSEMAKEKSTLQMQFNRYKNAKNGKKQAFDVAQNISTDRLFEYLEEAVKNTGKSEIKLKMFLEQHEPDNTLKVDWKGIEAEIKNWCEKNNGFLCEDDDEYLNFIGDFFSESKFAVPDTEKNNDKIYALMGKYFESIYSD